MNIIIFFLGSFLYLSTAMAGESVMGKMLAPGPLSLPHAKYEESQCEECHLVGKGVPQSQCLKCHEEIENKIKDGRGLHGYLSSKQNCIECHGEHKGRNFDSTKFEWKNFDHQKVGYPLKGLHRKVSCRDCHTEKRGSDKYFRSEHPRFLHTPVSCRECHKDDDPHHYQGEMAKNDCSKCHVESGWKVEPKFDHNTQTQFALTGGHTQVKCADCHTPKDKDPIYQWPKLKTDQCLSCHDDYHQENLGEKFQGGNCLQCHSEDSWKMKSFNHDMTDFTLIDKHAETDCLECHKQEEMSGQSQLKKTSWAKGGPHRWSGLKQDCLECHRPTHHEKFDLTKYELKCTTCHDTKSFKEEKLAATNFKHQLTAFELTGVHKQTSCRDCHRKQVGVDEEKLLFSKSYEGDYEQFKSKFQFKKVSDQFCLDCHQTPHEKQFHEKFSKKSCHECHSTESFEAKHRLNFDHTQTSFSLKGKHRDIDCQKCHTSTHEVFTKSQHAQGKYVFPTLAAKSCRECHDDYHKGEMGQQCASCHNEEDWKTRTDFHAGFSLQGVHHNVSCRECHGENRKLAGLGGQCLVCHQKDDIHHGSLNQCGDCHHQDVWEHPKFKHSSTRFPLQGAHRQVSCRECHSVGVYQGTARNCLSCHQIDAASVSFPTHLMPQFQDCSRCHNQFQF